MANPKVFFDITADGKPVGRVIMEVHFRRYSHFHSVGLWREWWNFPLRIELMFTRAVGTLRGLVELQTRPVNRVLFAPCVHCVVNMDDARVEALSWGKVMRKCNAGVRIKWAGPDSLLFSTGAGQTPILSKSSKSTSFATLTLTLLRFFPAWVRVESYWKFCVCGGMGCFEFSMHPLWSSRLGADFISNCKCMQFGWVLFLKCRTSRMQNGHFNSTYSWKNPETSHGHMVRVARRRRALAHCTTVEARTWMHGAVCTVLESWYSMPTGTS